MRVEVLGPVRVSGADGRAVAIPRLERLLVAVLALRAGQVVPVEDVVDALWDRSPPQRARNQVHKAVSGLRGHLRRAGVDPSVVVTEPAGYRLQVPAGTVDLVQFRELVTLGRAEAAAGRAGPARDALRRALRLWRGAALAGETGAVLSAAAESLNEEQARATEECLEAELAAGGAGELVAELTELVRQYPYREGLHAALMTALYRAGRAAEALAVFRRARGLLREELGTEPGPRLQQLHQAVLRGDPALEATGGSTTGAATGGPGARAMPVPRELPPEASWFIGRQAEADRVRKVLASAGGESRDRDRHRPAVLVLYGPGGVGKSALGARVGHELADTFTEGQVYVDLCGSTPGMRPLPAAEVLGRLLRSLGVDPREIPSEVADAAALLRSVSADRRLLVVLDNAADAGQVAPVLPASGSCAVLVTSRHPLPELDADDRLRLPGLPEGECVRLLTGLAGHREVAPEAARAIVAATGGLPLAVRVAGGRLAARPDLPAAEYAERLADGSRRLDELSLDRLDVRACIRVAYDALLDGDAVAQRAARAFRALGVLHVPDVAPGVVAAMLDERDATVAEVALDRLVAVQLLEAVPGGRYRLHDLVRLVATELASEQDSQTDRDGMFDRALAYYISWVQHAELLLRPGQSWVFEPPTEASAASVTDRPLSPECARSWITAELPSLVVLLCTTFETSATDRKQLSWFAEALWSWLHARCEWQAAKRVAAVVAAAGVNRGDLAVAALGSLLRGRCEADTGHYATAERHFWDTLERMRQVRSIRGQALALVALGLVTAYQHSPEDAVPYYLESLDLAMMHDIVTVQIAAYNNLSSCYVGSGKLDEAVAAAEKSLAIRDRLGFSYGRGSTLNNLAAAHCLGGDLTKAAQRADEALSVSQATYDHQAVREALIIESEVALRQGRTLEARRYIQQALTLIRTTGDRYCEALALHQNTRVLAAAGQPCGVEQDCSSTTITTDARARTDTVLEKLIPGDPGNRNRELVHTGPQA